MSLEMLEQNPDIAKQVWNLVVESSNAKTELELKQGSLKDMKARAKTEFGVSGKEFTTLLNLYHNQARDEFEESKNEILNVYDTIEKAGKAKP